MSRQQKSEAEILQEKKERLAELQRRQMLPHIYGWNWYEWAWKFYTSKNRFKFLCAANQISKANCIEEKIPTPTGFVRMGDLNVGDMVFSKDGEATKIIDIPFIGEDDSFKIIFNDFSSTVVSKNHLWIAKGYKERFKKQYTNNRARSKNRGVKWANSEYGIWNTYSTEQIISIGGYNTKASPTKRFVIPITKAVEYSEKNIFDPYYIGVFLGNGSTMSITNNPKDTDVINYCRKYGNLRKKSGVIGICSSIWGKLLELNVANPSDLKKIPSEYMFGSIEQRKSLLAGLMDTDGTCGKTGQTYNFCSTSKVLAEQILEIVCSLGGFGHIKMYPSYYYKDNGEKVSCKDHFVVSIWTEFNPFRSKRKYSYWKPNVRYKHERVITEIIPLGKRKMKCITVEAECGSFLCTRDYLVTHNSSTQIREFIDHATDKTKWKDLWRQTPNQFWYLYPTKPVATTEFHEKWVPELLPRGAMKNDETYGWEEEYKNKEIWAIHFKSGISIYFKTYAQDSQDLQSGSVYKIGGDEEMPFHIFNELRSRLTATGGYFSMCFTATLGQDEWRRTMEPANESEELFPKAFKQTISMYDCLTYKDGTKSHWTLDRIKEIEEECSSEAEIQRRVYGRFVISSGLKIPGFSRVRNIVPYQQIDPVWAVYTGTDIGGGGERGHPASIIFIAVRPDGKYGIIFKGWRGDGIVTSSSDILEKHQEMCTREVVTDSGEMKTVPIYPVLKSYDWNAKDFFIMSSRAGEGFTPADKRRDAGFGIMNTLFKLGMLVVMDGDPELQKLIVELTSLQEGQAKQTAKDDMTDAARYCLMPIPWNFEDVSKEIIKDGGKDVDTRTAAQKHFDERLSGQAPEEDESRSLEEEFDEWNGYLDPR